MRATLAPRNLTIAVAIACATAAGAAHAAKPGAKTALFTAEIRLDVDATGRVTAAEPNDKVPAALKASVIEQAKAWRFQAPMRNGVPLAGTTYARTSVCAADDDRGGLILKMGDVFNGPGWDTNKFSHFFPPITSELVAMKKLEMDVVYDVGADGRASLVSVATMPEKFNSRRQIEGALKKWLATSRFLPEQLDGEPVATRMRMPVTFAWEEGNVSAKQLQRRYVQSHPTCQALLNGASQANATVALDSPFRVQPSS